MALPAKKSLSSVEDQKQEYLSISTLNEYASSSYTNGRPRSPSASSVRSSATQVEVSTEFAPTSKERGYKVVKTDIEIQLSFMDCLKGILRPWRAKSRKVTAEVVVIDDHEEPPQHQEPNKFIPKVCVLSNSEDAHGRSIEKEAKCMLDTGNHQGNLVSKTFLIEELGFEESHFGPLRESDKYGKSASGHPVVPESAVKLTWYFPSSNRMYRDMRFLVLPNSDCELVLCAQTIQKYNILAAPNFSDTERDREHIRVPKTKDAEELKLNSAHEKLTNELLTVKREVKDARKVNDETKAQRKERQIGPLKTSIKEAKKALNDYTEKKKKEEDSKKASNVPQVTITNLKGATRAMTGMSHRTMTSAK